MRGRRFAALLLTAACLTASHSGSWNFSVHAAGVQPEGEAPEAGQPGTGTSKPGQSGEDASGIEAPEAGQPGTEDQAQTEGWPTPPEVTGGRAILMEANSGTILFEKNSRQQGYPASITKIATAIVAIENGNFSDQVTFSHDAVFKTEGSGIWRDVDEVMTLEECMYAMMLESANECAYAIAEHVGGTYEEFVGMMNAKAAELGCQGTNFNNPHGLPDEEHLTTCYDMALISCYALQNDTFRQIVGTVRYDIPPTNKHEEITYLTNHHKMMKQSESRYYEPCIGGKTGYTQVSGHTLVTFAEKEGVTLVTVVMQEDKTSQYEDTRALLDWGFEHFYNSSISRNIAEEGQQTEGEFLETGRFADLDQEAVVTLPKGVSFAETEQELAMTNDPQAAGILQFTYNKKPVGAANILRTMEEIVPYPFQEAPETPVLQEEAEQPEAGVNSWLIVGIVLGVILLAGLGFGIYLLKDNFHWIRHRIMNRQRGQIHRHIIGRKSRRRRR
ncbi:MAG: D-alanyl-D-alanine carboxypeptidase [Lachnospiraceae bacterium]|nr:D-alanyl-D-alanine carboxypeptidase [Lachnospiraceae bacterium]